MEHYGSEIGGLIPTAFAGPLMFTGWLFVSEFVVEHQLTVVETCYSKTELTHLYP